MSLRTERIADLIRTELSELIRRELRDPRVALATVSGVEVSADLRHANVRISAIGDEAARLQTMKGLDSARGFLRRELAQRLSLRVTPELKFHLDRGAEHSQEISDLLDRLHREDRGDA